MFVMQIALAPVPVSAHVPPKVPVLLLENVTVPVGAVGFELMSVTVAEQLEASFTMTVVGVQLTVVVVE